MSEIVSKALEGLELTVSSHVTKQLAKTDKLESDLKKVVEAQNQLIAERQSMSFGSPVTKSFNQLLAESIAEHTDDIAKFARKEKKSVDFLMKAVGDMSFTSNFGTAAVSTGMVYPGIVSTPSRKVHVRDLLPQSPMNGSTLYYMKETGGEGAPATVAEGTLKQQIDIDMAEAAAPAEYIAGWVRISTKMLDDVPAMTGFLQSRLLEKLLVAEDAQLVNGDGTAPNISGITDAGNFTAAAGAATVDVEQIVQAISQLEELDREATGIVLRPSDYWNIALNKASGSGEYDLPGIVTLSADGILRIAGVPVSRTTAMTADKFIVGDFAQGAMLLLREAPRVEFFREDGTNVRENKITVRVEERIAFPIFGSTFFIYGDLGNVA